MYDVGFEAGKKRLSDKLRRLASPLIGAINESNWPRGMPNADIFLRQQAIERRADGFDSLWEEAREREDDFVFSPIAGNGLGKGHGIAADAALTICSLRPLHVDDDAHQACSFCFCSMAVLSWA